VAIDIRASLDRNALRSISKQSGLSVFAYQGTEVSNQQSEVF
jgi:hypothetical protein